MRAGDFISRSQFCTLASLDSGVEVVCRGPTLIRANGLRVAANGGAGSEDFGCLPLYYAPNVPTVAGDSFRFQGNCAYLPYGGSWYIFRAFAGRVSGVSPVVSTDLVSFSIFDNVGNDLVEYLALSVIPATAFTVRTSLLGSAALSANGAADFYSTGGAKIAVANYFNIIGCSISNTGAQPAFVWMGDGNPGIANFGYRLAANGTVLFPPGSISGLSAVYGSCIAGTNLDVTWMVK